MSYTKKKRAITGKKGGEKTRRKYGLKHYRDIQIRSVIKRKQNQKLNESKEKYRISKT